MPKLDYLQHKKLNPGDELREILDRLSERSSRIKKLDPDQALIRLQELDEAYRLFNDLEVAGLDLTPEKGRFKAVQAHFQRQVGPLLKGLGGRAALHRYRPDPSPSRERWWWYIDEMVAAQQQHLFRRVVKGAIILALVVAGLVLAFRTVLAPSPEAVARVEAQSQAFTSVDEGDYRAALASVEEGLQKVPDDPGLLIFRGALYQLLGQEQEAEQSFGQAQASIDDPFFFSVGRSQLYLRLNKPKEAERDARAALELEEESAQAWLLLGQALELQEQRFDAVLAYEKAGDLALASGDNEVYVLARMALGRLGLN